MERRVAVGDADRDTARLVAWLLSDEADWITGQTIASDGGWSSR